MLPEVDGSASELMNSERISAYEVTCVCVFVISVCRLLNSVVPVCESRVFTL